MGRQNGPTDPRDVVNLISHYASLTQQCELSRAPVKSFPSIDGPDLGDYLSYMNERECENRIAYSVAIENTLKQLCNNEQLDRNNPCMLYFRSSAQSEYRGSGI